VVTAPSWRRLDLLAYGEPLALGTLTALTTRSAVEIAETQGLVAVAVDGDRTLARLAHPLFAEAPRARGGGPRARAALRAGPVP